MIKKVKLEDKTYTEQVIQKMDCSTIEPIGDGSTTINGSSFNIYDKDTLTPQTATMLGTAGYDATAKVITVVVKKNTGTRGEWYWLVGKAVCADTQEFVVVGEFKIVNDVGPVDLT